MEILTFGLAQPETDEAGRMTARIVPFGEQVDYGGEPIRFEAGGLETPDKVPLTVDHGDSVLDRIGVMQAFQEGDDGAYASFDFADTSRAQDVRSLLAAGAVSDVSIGVSNFDVADGVMTGVLDHVSVVPHGRFGQANKPSQVLAVHDVKEPLPMAEETLEATPEVAQYDDTDLRSEMANMQATLLEVVDTFNQEKPAEFAGIDDTILDKAIEGALERRADFALADVVGDLGSADASGLNPDYYWAEGIQQEMRQWRPLFDQAGTAPFPDYGLNMTSARVSQDVAVGSGKAQKAETATQALQVIGTTFPVVFHSGAVDVALELISQSNPSVIRVLRNSFLKVYATATDVDAVAKALAAATATGAALRTDSYVNLVTDLRNTGVLIRNATGSFGNKVAVTSAEFTAILTLVDGTGRRYFSVSAPNNADGSANLVSESVNIAGFTVFEDPNVANAFQFNEETLITHEKSPSMIQATAVDKMGLDMGIIGASVVSHWPAGLYKYTV